LATLIIEIKMRTYHRKKKDEESTENLPMENKSSAFERDWEKCRDRHTGQKEVIKAYIEEGKQYIFNRAGRKFAKTTTNIDLAWWHAMKHPKSVIYMCFPTITQGIEVVWEERRLQNCDTKTDIMRERYVKSVNDNKHMITFKNGSYIKLIGTWTEARGRGTQPDMLIVDEVQDCSADYLDAMNPNLAAKNGRCIMSGTPSKRRNHYHEWENRISNMPNGRIFHYNSYANDAVPHLKEWLDNERLSLIASGKEDVWKREYLAEDCFSSADRILPDAKFMDYEDIVRMVLPYEYESRIPVISTIIHERYFCSVMGVLVPKKALFITDLIVIPQVWCRRFHEMYEEVSEKISGIQQLCGGKTRNLVYDPTSSFQDLIMGYTGCRTDLKWQKRGMPILREMMLGEKIKFNNDVADFGLECQKMFLDEKQTEIEQNYPISCAMAVMANEYFQPDPVKIETIGKFDKMQALREAGIVPQPPKKPYSRWRVGSF